MPREGLLKCLSTAGGFVRHLAVTGGYPWLEEKSVSQGQGPGSTAVAVPGATTGSVIGKLAKCQGREA
jgi:hypothetical protein